MFDSTCKFISATFSRDIATWLLGKPIDLPWQKNSKEPFIIKSISKKENNKEKFIMSNKTIDANKVQLTLKELLSLVNADTEIIITEGNKPLARLISFGETEETITETSSLRQPGLHPETIWTSEDFDEPLPEEFWTGK